MVQRKKRKLSCTCDPFRTGRTPTYKITFVLALLGLVVGDGRNEFRVIFVRKHGIGGSRSNRGELQFGWGER